MVEGSCPFRRRSEELAADVRLLGDGSPELYPESLIVRAEQKERGIWFNILLLNEIQACHEQKTAVCLSELQRGRYREREREREMFQQSLSNKTQKHSKYQNVYGRKM